MPMDERQPMIGRLWSRLAATISGDGETDAPTGSRAYDPKRYRRLEDRAAGIRHALKSSTLTDRDRRGLENNLRNLKLALRGMRALRGKTD